MNHPLAFPCVVHHQNDGSFFLNVLTKTKQMVGLHVEKEHPLYPHVSAAVLALQNTKDEVVGVGENFGQETYNVWMTLEQIEVVRLEGELV